MKNKLRHIIREELQKFFEDVYSAPVHGGTTVGQLEDFPFGIESFHTMPEEQRIEVVNNKFNELLKQFDGDRQKAIEELPAYMSLYI